MTYDERVAHYDRTLAALTAHLDELQAEVNILKASAEQLEALFPSASSPLRDPNWAYKTAVKQAVIRPW